MPDFPKNMTAYVGRHNFLSCSSRPASLTHITGNVTGCADAVEDNQTHICLSRAYHGCSPGNWKKEKFYMSTRPTLNEFTGPPAKRLLRSVTPGCRAAWGCLSTRHRSRVFLHDAAFLNGCQDNCSCSSPSGIDTWRLVSTPRSELLCSNKHRQRPLPHTVCSPPLT